MYIHNVLNSLLGRHIKRNLKEENTDDLLVSRAFICETITTSDYIRRMLRNNTDLTPQDIFPTKVSIPRIRTFRMVTDTGLGYMDPNDIYNGANIINIYN